MTISQTPIFIILSFDLIFILSTLTTTIKWFLTKVFLIKCLQFYLLTFLIVSPSNFLPSMFAQWQRYQLSFLSSSFKGPSIRILLQYSTVSAAINISLRTGPVNYKLTVFCNMEKTIPRQFFDRIYGGDGLIPGHNRSTSESSSLSSASDVDHSETRPAVSSNNLPYMNGFASFRKYLLPLSLIPNKFPHRNHIAIPLPCWSVK